MGFGFRGFVVRDVGENRFVLGFRCQGFVRSSRSGFARFPGPNLFSHGSLFASSVCDVHSSCSQTRDLTPETLKPQPFTSTRALQADAATRQPHAEAGPSGGVTLALSLPPQMNIKHTAPQENTVGTTQLIIYILYIYIYIYTYIYTYIYIYIYIYIYERRLAPTSILCPFETRYLPRGILLVRTSSKREPR